MFSIVSGLETVLHLFILARPITLFANLVDDLAILLVKTLPVTFLVSVAGPSQWWRDAADGMSLKVLAGTWELAGLIGLLLLE